MLKYDSVKCMFNIFEGVCVLTGKQSWKVFKAAISNFFGGLETNTNYLLNKFVNICYENCLRMIDKKYDFIGN